MSLSFNLATILGGGLTPFVATWLVQATGHPVAPAFYVVAAAAVGLLTVLASAETSKQRLE